MTFLTSTGAGETTVIGRTTTTFVCITWMPSNDFTHIYPQVDEDPDRDIEKGDDGNEVDWHIQVKHFLSATTFSATFSARARFGDLQQFDAQVALNNLLPNPLEDDAQSMPRVRSARLLVAATWITIAGEQIHQACQSADELSRVTYNRAANQKADGSFSPARWNCWKQQFQELARSTELDPRSVNLASHALARMKDLESG